MNDRHQLAWNRLVAAARRAPAAPSEERAAPSGFATRVVARAGLRPAPVGGLGGLLGAGFERLAGRALGLAGACALVVAVWGSLPAASEARAAEPADSPATDVYSADAYLDPVGDYLAAVQSS